MTDTLQLGLEGQDSITLIDKPPAVDVVLAIVGSQRMPGDVDGQIRQLMWNTLLDLKPEKCVSGGCEGIDTIFEYIADLLGYSRHLGNFIVHLPVTKRWRTGYAPRNLLIAKECTHLLRIYDSRSTTYGSGWTADRAEELNRYVQRVDEHELRRGTVNVEWRL